MLIIPLIPSYLLFFLQKKAPLNQARQSYLHGFWLKVCLAVRKDLETMLCMNQISHVLSLQPTGRLHVQSHRC